MAALFLGAALSAATTDAQPGPPANVVSEITLERQCFGCADAGEVTLRNDGSARRVAYGSARMGIARVERVGTIEPARFRRLATLLVEEGFFDLQDVYKDPQLQDGETWTTTAVRAGRSKSVRNANDAAPARLKKIEKEITAVAETIVWTSGS